MFFGGRTLKVSSKHQCVFVVQNSGCLAFEGTISAIKN